jgi:hypothetical protein
MYTTTSDDAHKARKRPSPSEAAQTETKRHKPTATPSGTSCDVAEAVQKMLDAFTIASCKKPTIIKELCDIPMRTLLAPRSLLTIQKLSRGISDDPGFAQRLAPVLARIRTANTSRNVVKDAMINVAKMCKGAVAKWLQAGQTAHTYGVVMPNEWMTSAMSQLVLPTDPSDLNSPTMTFFAARAEVQRLRTLVWETCTATCTPEDCFRCAADQHDSMGLAALDPDVHAFGLAHSIPDFVKDQPLALQQDLAITTAYALMKFGTHGTTFPHVTQATSINAASLSVSTQDAVNTGGVGTTVERRTTTLPARDDARDTQHAAAATQGPAGPSPESDQSAHAREALAAVSTTISLDDAPVTAPTAHVTKTVHGDAAVTSDPKTQTGEGGLDETTTCDGDTMATMDAAQSNGPPSTTRLDAPTAVVPGNIEDNQLISRVIVDLVGDLIARTLWTRPGLIDAMSNAEFALQRQAGMTAAQCRSQIMTCLFAPMSIPAHSQILCRTARNGYRITTHPPSEWNLWEAIMVGRGLRGAGMSLFKILVQLARDSHPVAIRGTCGDGDSAKTDWYSLGGGKLISDGGFEPILILLAEFVLQAKILAVIPVNYGWTRRGLSWTDETHSLATVMLLPTIDQSFLQHIGAIGHLCAKLGRTAPSDLPLADANTNRFMTTHFHSVRVTSDTPPGCVTIPWDIPTRWLPGVRNATSSTTSGLPVDDATWAFGPELAEVDKKALEMIQAPEGVRDAEAMATLTLLQLACHRTLMAPTRTMAAHRTRDETTKKWIYSSESYDCQMDRVGSRLTHLVKHNKRDAAPGTAADLLPARYETQPWPTGANPAKQELDFPTSPLVPRQEYNEKTAAAKSVTVYKVPQFADRTLPQPLHFVVPTTATAGAAQPTTATTATSTDAAPATDVATMPLPAPGDGSTVQGAPRPKRQKKAATVRTPAPASVIETENAGSGNAPAAAQATPEADASATTLDASADQEHVAAVAKQDKVRGGRKKVQSTRTQKRPLTGNASSTPEPTPCAAKSSKDTKSGSHKAPTPASTDGAAAANTRAAPPTQEPSGAATIFQAQKRPDGKDATTAAKACGMTSRQTDPASQAKKLPTIAKRPHKPPEPATPADLFRKHLPKELLRFSAYEASDYWQRLEEIGTSSKHKDKLQAFVDCIGSLTPTIDNTRLTADNRAVLTDILATCRNNFSTGTHPAVIPRMATTSVRSHVDLWEKLSKEIHSKCSALDTTNDEVRLINTFNYMVTLYTALRQEFAGMYKADLTDEKSLPESGASNDATPS